MSGRGDEIPDNRIDAAFHDGLGLGFFLGLALGVSACVVFYEFFIW